MTDWERFNEVWQWVTLVALAWRLRDLTKLEKRLNGQAKKPGEL